ncbi:hypothetical protein SDC9_212447 [bioreactor metagenome]|uniref:Uncharacterized protein n=1 Tax=bioreactor metagenome TaxID=1076179 RepID=A0A645JM23_9ZZZZ
MLVRGFLHRRNYANRRGKLDGARIIHHEDGKRLGQAACQQPDRDRTEKAERNDSIRQMLRTALRSDFHPQSLHAPPQSLDHLMSVIGSGEDTPAPLRFQLHAQLTKKIHGILRRKCR